MDAEVVRGIIPKILEEIKTKKRTGADALEAWNKVVGEKIKRHTRPILFQKGLLIVNVDCAGWLYELNLYKPILLRRLKKRADMAQLKGLRFRIGTV